MRDWFKYLTGGFAVYAAMAACSSSNGGSFVEFNAGAPSERVVSDAGGERGSGTSGAGGTGSGVAAPFFGVTGMDAGPAGGSDTTATGGAASGGAGPVASMVGAVMDAMVDPVPEAMADAYESGSRIKARFHVTDGGAKAFAGLWDSELDIECAFHSVSAGQSRCFPVVNAYVSPSYFADAACAQPLAYTTGPCGGVPKYSLSTKTGCTEPAAYPSDLFATGAAHTGDVYQRVADDCVALSQGVLDTFAASSYRFYLVGNAVPESTFALATVGE